MTGSKSTFEMIDAGADKDAAAYYVRAMEKSQEKGDWFKHLGLRD